MTIKQHIAQLPEDVREKAMKYERKRWLYVWTIKKIETQSQALSMAFSWRSSTEGYDYWLNIYNQLKAQGK